MGKKSDPPPAPDYRGAAMEQAAAGEANLAQQNWANRPTQITPWGRTDWGTESAIDPATGQPVTKWTQTESLTPVSQEALNDQLDIMRGRSGLAKGQIERVAGDFEKPFDWTNLPQSPGSMSEAQQEAYGRMQEFQKADRQQGAAELDQQLANQGITPGTPAYETAMRRMSDANARQDLQNLQASFGEGRAQGDFQAKTRAQAIAEQAQRRGMSLNELNALISGQQVATPQFQGFSQSGIAQAPDLMGAMKLGYDANMDAVNAKNAQAGQTMNMIGQVGGMAAMAF